MQIGMVGLGRMGANMARRLIRKGHTCVVFNRSPQAVSFQPGSAFCILERQIGTAGPIFNTARRARRIRCRPAHSRPIYAAFASITA